MFFPYFILNIMTQNKCWGLRFDLISDMKMELMAANVNTDSEPGILIGCALSTFLWQRNWNITMEMIKSNAHSFDCKRWKYTDRQWKIPFKHDTGREVYHSCVPKSRGVILDLMKSNNGQMIAFKASGREPFKYLPLEGSLWRFWLCSHKGDEKQAQIWRTGEEEIDKVKWRGWERSGGTW